MIVNRGLQNKNSDEKRIYLNTHAECLEGRKFRMKQPTLFIFSGLPASGKSTLAKELAKKMTATFIRIDTLEQGLLDICKYKVQGGEGYESSRLIASDNLKLGNSVVADSVNPWEITRKSWNDVAISNQSLFVNIEVICSNSQEHKTRVENRNIEIKKLQSEMKIL